MEVLWAPWRMAYIGGGDRPQNTCIFCLPEGHRGPLRDRLVLFSDDVCLVMMNRYPYNNGHLMVAPRRHIGTLAETAAEERLALLNQTARATEILGRAMSPEGFNMGINQGRPAGAGVLDHLHLHVTPRYVGDNNYMTVLAEVRVIPEHILATFDKLVDSFNG